VNYSGESFSRYLAFRVDQTLTTSSVEVET